MASLIMLSNDISLRNTKTSVCLMLSTSHQLSCIDLHHDDVMKWKHFPRYWPFVWGIHRPPVNFPHKSQWRGVLMFSLIFAWMNGREAGDLRRHRAHYGVTVMIIFCFIFPSFFFLAAFHRHIFPFISPLCSSLIMVISFYYFFQT